MEKGVQIEVYNLLKRDLGLETNDTLSEAEILAILVDRVKSLLTEDKDLLMSFLYRLDISQRKILNVLRVTNIIPPEQSLAALILERQKERVATKLKYKQPPPIEGWEF